MAGAAPSGCEEEDLYSGCGEPAVVTPHDRRRHLTPPDCVSAGRLFDGCCRAEQVPAAALVTHLRASLPDTCGDWVRSVARLLDPDGRDPAVTKAEFAAAVSAANSARRQLLRPAALPESTPAESSDRRCSAVSRVSSLGILDCAEMDLSFGSFEALGQQLTPPDPAVLESTIAQLEHSSRALQAERDQLQLQLQQLEESNVQLSAALAQLAERSDSAAADAARLASLRAECEQLQAALEAETADRRAGQQHADHLERLVAAQQAEIEQLAAKVSATEAELRAASGQQRRLLTALEHARRESAQLREELEDGAAQQRSAQATIDSLHATVREMRDSSLALQEENSRYSDELSCVRRQLVCLRSAPRDPDPASGPASALTSDSIHDEIISTIQSTQDADPELPLSGIASPELVHAIAATPLRLHFGRAPTLSSTPRDAAPLWSPRRQQEFFSPAASESGDSPERRHVSADSVSASGARLPSPRPERTSQACQTERPTSRDAQTEPRSGPLPSSRCTQTEPRSGPLPSSRCTQTEPRRGPLPSSRCTQTDGDWVPEVAASLDRLSRLLGAGDVCRSQSLPEPHAADLERLLRLVASQLQKQDGTPLQTGSLRPAENDSDGTSCEQLSQPITSIPTTGEDPDEESEASVSVLQSSVSVPCDQPDVGVFPSLTDHMLASLTIETDENANNTNEADLASQFSCLSLAFRTDRQTLQERLDVQRRHRDQAELSLETETQRLRAAAAGRPLETRPLQRQVDVVRRTSQRLSRAAHVLGAAQQEMRLSRAVEVMTKHVESVRRQQERQQAELSDARRLLAAGGGAALQPGPTDPAAGETDAAGSQRDDQPPSDDQSLTDQSLTTEPERGGDSAEPEEAGDIKALLVARSDAWLQRTGRPLRWPYSRQETLVRARYCAGALFLVLAVVVLLVPTAHTSCSGGSHVWHSWSELLSGHLSLRHVHRPPL